MMALTWDFGGALGGTRTPNLLIRRNGHIVQDCPSSVVGWVDIPELSMCVGRRPAAWLQSWRNAADPVAVTVAVSGWSWSPSPGSPRRCDSTLFCPDPSPEPDSCRTIRQPGSVKGRRSRSRSDAKGALDRFRLS